MSMLLTALDLPEAASSKVTCLSDSPQPTTIPELSREARRAAAWLRDLSGTGGTVAALLTASVDCLAVVVAAFRSGVTLVSLPHPARGMGAEEYLSQLAQMCTLTGASHLLADPEYLSLLDRAPVPVHGFNEFGPTQSLLTDYEPGSFVQFTSGSTGTPRGIALSLDAIEANMASMFEWLQPPTDSVVCSWLPLSHDMGLIGYVLCGLCSVCPPWSRPTDIVLLKPEAILANPGLWLQACTDFRATSTAAPPFALRFASRALRSGTAHYDLSSLRSFVVGSEPISAEGLRAFTAEAGAHGLSPHAICPGYGLAEVSLAAAMVSPDVPWTSVRVDPEALADQEWNEVDQGGREVVSCGTALSSVELRVAGQHPVGELEVKSPSLLSHYVGDPASHVGPDGWLHTADLAHYAGDQLYVVGRADDVFVIAGRNIDARALDSVAGSHPATRPGNAAVVRDGGGRYLVVAEPSSPGADTAALRQAALDIRGELVRQFAASPSAVLFIERGTLPKTPSGKVRRNHLEALAHNEKLQVLVSG
jgi:acyl-CoA synthetase (AMP-forming)/AMP-acid ligase II